MHRRVLAAVFAAVAVLPAASFAQRPPLQAAPASGGVRVTPFVGYLAGFTRNEEWLHESSDGIAFLQAELRIAAGEAAGLVLELPLHAGFGFTTAAGYGSRGDTEVSVLRADDDFLVDGHTILLGRAGIYYMPQQISELVVRRLAVSAFAGATVMRERPRHRLAPDDAFRDATHYGLNLGFAAELPFAGDRLAVQLAVEDNLTWWDEPALANLPWVYLNRPGASLDQTRVTARRSHQLLLRAGVRIRLF
jgi:hypothetical protein